MQMQGGEPWYTRSGVVDTRASFRMVREGALVGGTKSTGGWHRCRFREAGVSRARLPS